MFLRKYWRDMAHLGILANYLNLRWFIDGTMFEIMMGSVYSGMVHGICCTLLESKPSLIMARPETHAGDMMHRPKIPMVSIPCCLPKRHAKSS